MWESHNDHNATLERAGLTADGHIHCEMAQTLQNAQEKLSTMTGGMLGAEYKFPAFDELPKVEGMPQGSIWGFYDKNGKKDEIGCPLRLPTTAET
jgi:hypothetical protein